MEADCVSLWLVWNVYCAIHILMLTCGHKFGFPVCFILSQCPVFVQSSACLPYVIRCYEYYSLYFLVISEVDLRYTAV
jgi:hypothetical protein